MQEKYFYDEYYDKNVISKDKLLMSLCHSHFETVYFLDYLASCNLFLCVLYMNLN